MSIVPKSMLYRKPVGLFWGLPSGATVASRPSRCVARYANSASLKDVMIQVSALVSRPPGPGRAAANDDPRQARLDGSMAEWCRHDEREPPKQVWLASGDGFRVWISATGFVTGFRVSDRRVSGFRVRTPASRSLRP